MTQKHLASFLLFAATEIFLCMLIWRYSLFDSRDSDPLVSFPFVRGHRRLHPVPAHLDDMMVFGAHALGLPEIPNITRE
ncbi:hypothetical protein EV361DRAFT_921749 [Lentinula raphanica]|nr:hypothetical protein EV361DRAFT_921749 [Lentinula raphanica]